MGDNASKSREWKETVILDVGSGCVKAGLSSDRDPKIVTATVVGYPKASEATETSIVVGYEAIEKSDQLRLIWPVRRGIIIDFEAWSAIIRYVLNKLDVDPGNHPIFITEPILNPTQQRIRIAEYLFETLNVPGIYFGLHPLLALFSVGKVTGLVVESGEGLTQIIAVQESYPLHHSAIRIPIGGIDITRYLMKLIMRKGIHISSEYEIEHIRRIKEKACYLETDYESKLRLARGGMLEGEKFELPNGRTIVLHEEKFVAPEIIYRPSLIGLKTKPLDEAITEAIFSVDIDVRPAMYPNIIISGGNTKIRGFIERLQNELLENIPERAKDKLNIGALKDREYCVYRGATILTNLPAFRKILITKEKWAEEGPSSVLGAI